MDEEILLVRWLGINVAPITIPKAIFNPKIHTLYEQENKPAPEPSLEPTPEQPVKPIALENPPELPADTTQPETEESKPASRKKN